MSAPPLKSEIAGTPSNAQAKAGFASLWDYVVGRLGGDATAPAPSDAEKEATRQALGIASDSMQNMLINPGGGLVYQRSVASTADDVYFADRWYALTQSGAITPSVLTDPENGYTHGVRMTQSQATAQRFGYAQIIEGKNCKRLRGGSGVFAPRVRVSASQPIRYAILGWTGTEDLVTSDVVNDWNSASFAPSGFFLSANVSVIAVGAQTPTANTWTTLGNIYGSMGSTFNNVIIMVWTEGVAAQNFTLDFDWNEFNKGAIVMPPNFRDVGRELMMCQRYYQLWQVGYADAVSTIATRYFVGSFAVEMRATPTVGGTSAVESETNVSSFAIGPLTVRGARYNIVPTASAPIFASRLASLIAEL
jgi:hypothetical protein